MSSEKSQTAPGAAPQHPQLDSYPPPPPGPPPSQQQHANETPIPDTDVPAFKTIHHTSSISESSLYDEATPVSSHPPSPFPPQQQNAPSESTKPGWSERLSQLGGKATAPLNMLANKMGSESFLPTTMDRECEKAARILKSFCSEFPWPPSLPAAGRTELTQVIFAEEGVHTDAEHPAPPVEGQAPKSKSKTRTLLTIPPRVISRAVGLAIFTTGRVGFHVSGSTGSGILISRLPDGRWSAPSGIQIHSVGAGFVYGVDIYDCVVVINTKEALKAFTRTRASLGSDLAVVAGPWGAGGSVDFAAPGTDKKGKGKVSGPEAAAAQPPTDAQQPQQHQGFSGGPSPAAQPQVTTGVETAAAPPQSFAGPPPPADRKGSSFRQAISQSKPVYSYVKSRGFYVGVQFDGTVITERKDANAALYGERVPVESILKGDVPPGAWQHHMAHLYDILRSVESWAPAPPGTAAYGSAAAGTTSSGVNINATVEAMRRMDMASDQQQAPPMNWKEREAAAERAAAAEHEASAAAGSAAPPGYSEFEHTEELPPAYVDEGHPRPGVGDSKTAPPPPPQ